MKKLALLFSLIATTCFSQVPPPATTPFTRSFLRSADGPAARTVLGFGSVTGQTYNASQFTIDVTTQANVKVGASFTNINLYATNNVVQGVTNPSTANFHWSFTGAGPNLAARALDITNSLAGFSNVFMIYVSPSGSDAAGHFLPGRPDRACATLTNAIRQIPTAWQTNTVISILPGVYLDTNAFSLRSNQAGNIVIANRTNLTIVGHGLASDLFFSNALSCIVITNCSQVTLKDLKIRGARQAPPIPTWATNVFGLGIFAMLSVADSADIVLDGLHMSGGYDHGIIADPQLMYVQKSTNRVVVRNCYLSEFGSYWGVGGNMQDGAAIVTGGRWHVYNNWIENCNTGIEPYPDANPSFDGTDFPPAVIEGNVVVNCIWIAIGTSKGQPRATKIANNFCYFEPGYTLYGWTNHPNHAAVQIDGTDHSVMNNVGVNYGMGFFMEQGHLTNLVLQGNRFIGTTNVGIDTAYGFLVNSRISGNIMTRCGKSGIHVGPTINSEISWNRVEGFSRSSSNGFDGIYMDSSSGNVTNLSICNNTIIDDTGFGANGINFVGANVWSSTVDGNHIVRFIPDGSLLEHAGINMVPTKGAFNLQNNRITGGWPYGIRIETSTNVLVTGNTVDGAYWSGINFINASRLISISENFVQRSTYHGIQVDGLKDGRIANNVVRDCGGVGIRLPTSKSSNTVFWGNYILDSRHGASAMTYGILLEASSSSNWAFGNAIFNMGSGNWSGPAPNTMTQ